MSIELLPFSAFALESCASPARAPVDGQTLTLSSLASGSMTFHVTEIALLGSERVCIAPTLDEPLTITF
ncbi:MAG TPA: hypothetical protein VL593_12525 [Ramlibacter sp.]|jgi:hypothetical protein|nr:hypothetical protein [Ramlibacter sp.]